MTTQDITCKPSQVIISVPPFHGLLRKAECEHALTCLVYTCAVNGDTWQEVTLDMFQSAILDLRRKEAAGETLTPQGQVFAALLKNPFFNPDFHALAKAGHVTGLESERSGPPLSITDATLRLLATKWVER